MWPVKHLLMKKKKKGIETTQETKFSEKSSLRPKQFSFPFLDSSKEIKY